MRVLLTAALTATLAFTVIKVRAGDPFDADIMRWTDDTVFFCHIGFF